MSAGVSISPAARIASSVRSTMPRQRAEGDLAVEKRGDGDLVGGVERGRRPCPSRQRLARNAQAPESARGRRLRRSAATSAMRSGRGDAAGDAVGMSQAMRDRRCACPGLASPAMVEPSSKAMRPCTIDCGCTTTASFSARDREEMMRFDQFEALVHQAGAVDARSSAPCSIWDARAPRRGSPWRSAPRSIRGTGRRKR